MSLLKEHPFVIHRASLLKGLIHCTNDRESKQGGRGGREGENQKRQSLRKMRNCSNLTLKDHIKSCTVMRTVKEKVCYDEHTGKERQDPALLRVSFPHWPVGVAGHPISCHFPGLSIPSVGVYSRPLGCCIARWAECVVMMEGEVLTIWGLNLFFFKENK